MSGRIRGLAVAAALQLVALVLAHELVFLARHGSRYGEALAHAGHGETWTAAVETTLLLAAALAVAGVLRLVHLGFLARSASIRRVNPGRPAPGRPAIEPLRLRELARLWLRVGPRIALLTVGLLTVQENLERASIGGPVPGPAILLSPEYAGGLWIATAVGLLVGLVAALFEWRRRALEARLRVASRPFSRRTIADFPNPEHIRRVATTSVLGRRSGLRAPPVPRLA